MDDIINNMKTSKALSVLAALAQERRLEVLRYVIRFGVAGVPAGRIAESCGTHVATLSFHLNGLRRAGLISSRRDGRSIYYAANYGTINELIGYLMDNCCEGEAGDASCVARNVPALRKPRRKSAVIA
jgi:ArsR family transcriptional regulator